MSIQTKEGVIPQERPTLTEWMAKHQVSTKVCSLNSGMIRAIESLDKEQFEILVKNEIASFEEEDDLIDEIRHLVRRYLD